MLKANKLLADLASEVDQGFIEDTYEVGGHQYTMRLLSDGENNWKNRYIDIITSSGALLSQQKAPTLAVAIRAIDGKSVDEIFPDPAAPAADATQEDKDYHERWKGLSSEARQFERAKMLLNYLSKRPDDFISMLWEKYQELKGRREEVMQNLKKS